MTLRNIWNYHFYFNYYINYFNILIYRKYNKKVKVKVKVKQSRYRLGVAQRVPGS
jgi:hypothetical protein